ncbi:hypothetical protein AK812_SmicGene4862 [Symbiodinium microadriaticum]|uniref:Uncharacterized protein n=1 Tax=Symbiodinium microadriaticum TaxID=2951 RepID=A0A1Q9EV72_SYMMI|nr:hypothetical protein AK812_SmicGene4862 [Symbiodinium microadriaticum]
MEGTPDFVSMEHGNVKGVYDKDGVGLILVALVAPGAMWRETSDETQKQWLGWAVNLSWSFQDLTLVLPTNAEGQLQKALPLLSRIRLNWLKVADAEASGKQSASDGWDMAFAPDSSALYDGAYNSRLFGTGTKVLLKGSKDSRHDTLDMLVVETEIQAGDVDGHSVARGSMSKSRGSAQQISTASTYCGVVDFAGQERTTGTFRTFPLEASGTEEEVQKDGKASEPTPVLAGMDVSDVMPTWWLVQLLLLLHRLQRSRGLVLSCKFPGALSLHFLISRDRHVLFLVDEALASSEFKKEGITSLVLFNSAGVDSSLCSLPELQDLGVPWGASSSFPARFGDRWAKSGARGGGNLAAGILYASDSMISKLAKETEAELLSAGAPWRRLRPGMEIDTTSGEETFEDKDGKVTFDFQGPSHLEVKWRARASTQESSNLSVVDRKEGSFSEFRLPADLGAPRAPADVAAETTFAVFTPISNFAVVGTEANRLLGQVSECAAQLHCSGCRVSMMPIALGGGEKGLRLAAALRELSTGGDAGLEVEEMCAGDLAILLRVSGSVTIGQLAAKHGDGFVEEKAAQQLRSSSLVALGFGTAIDVAFLICNSPTSSYDKYYDEDDDDRAATTATATLAPAAAGTRGVEIWLSYIDDADAAGGADDDDDDDEDEDEEEEDDHGDGDGCGDDDDDGVITREHAGDVGMQKIVTSTLTATTASENGSSDLKLQCLRSVAEELQMPIDRKSLQSFTRLLAHAFCHDLPTKAVKPKHASSLYGFALRSGRPSELPSAKEPLGVSVLQRAAKNLPEDGDGVTEQDRWGNDLRALSTLSLAGGEKDLPWRCFLTGTTFLEQLQESASLISEFEKLHPEEAVYAIGCVGILIRCRRSDASDVEPWPVPEHFWRVGVEVYVNAQGLDDLGQFLLCGLGAGVRLAPDVAVLDLDGSAAWLDLRFTNSTLYKSLSPLSLRSAEGQVGEETAAAKQMPKDTASTKVKTAELLINRPVKEGQEMSREETDWFREMLAVHLAAASATRRALQKRGGGPQSVCLALAAICFSEKAKPLWTKRGWGLRDLAVEKKILQLAMGSTTLQPRDGCKALVLFTTDTNRCAIPELRAQLNRRAGGRGLLAETSPAIGSRYACGGERKELEFGPVRSQFAHGHSTGYRSDDHEDKTTTATITTITTTTAASTTKITTTTALTMRMLMMTVVMMLMMMLMRMSLVNMSMSLNMNKVMVTLKKQKVMVIRGFWCWRRRCDS